MRKVIIVLAEPGIGGNAASSKFAREGTRGIEDLATVDIGSITALLGGSPAPIDGRVGDIGKGGISSVGEESAGRVPENDGRDIENDIRRDASEDFLLRFLLGLAISRVSLPLLSSTAPLSPTEPTLAVVAVDASLRPGENRENKLMNRRCLGVFTSLFRDWGFLPLEGVRGLKSEPDLTGSAAEGVKEAVVAMDQRDSEWIPASAVRRRCDCADASASSVAAVYAIGNFLSVVRSDQKKKKTYEVMAGRVLKMGRRKQAMLEIRTQSVRKAAPCETAREGKRCHPLRRKPMRFPREMFDQLLVMMVKQDFLQDTAV